MHEPVIGFPSSSCFSSSSSATTSTAANDPSPAAAAAVTCRSGQSVSTSTYRTKIADKCRLVTLTWTRRNHTHLLHTLTVSVSSADPNPNHHHHHRHTKLVDIKPWHLFWRRRSGSKRLPIDDDRRGSSAVEVFWDIRNAGAGGDDDAETPSYYVAVVCGGEVAVVVGDLKDEAYRKTGCRPAAIEPTLVSRKEHVFGKKRFETRVRFREKGRAHVITVEGGGEEDDEGEMVIRFDGAVGVRVGNLRWKFRGNEVVRVGDGTNSGVKVEVYWDVHDWLFNGDGLRRGLFVFKPVLEGGAGGGGQGLGVGNESSEYCLFLLYAWKVD